MSSKKSSSDSTSTIEDVVLLHSVFTEILNAGDSRGYIVVETDPCFNERGYHSLGIDYFKTSDSVSLSSPLTPNDYLIILNTNVDYRLGKSRHISANPYFKYRSASQRVITLPDIIEIQKAINAEYFFLFDNGGGVTFSFVRDGRLTGIATRDYIAAVRNDPRKTSKTD